jgi:hypothetical protein
MVGQLLNPKTGTCSLIEADTTTEQRNRLGNEHPIILPTLKNSAQNSDSPGRPEPSPE